MNSLCPNPSHAHRDEALCSGALDRLLLELEGKPGAVDFRFGFFQSVAVLLDKLGEYALLRVTAGEILQSCQFFKSLTWICDSFCCQAFLAMKFRSLSPAKLVLVYRFDGQFGSGPFVTITRCELSFIRLSDPQTDDCHEKSYGSATFTVQPCPRCVTLFLRFGHLFAAGSRRLAVWQTAFFTLRLLGFPSRLSGVLLWILIAMKGPSTRLSFGRLITLNSLRRENLFLRMRSIWKARRAATRRAR